ncbi:MFS transporter [Bartonella sp. HY038]|uniref:MFS transporter n=1 Tax=Bartonella sp. HY038 TaxID=2759660 RepID=UPI0015FE2365|nr:MFS transporter [Bartonella sp. HY038]
MGNEHSGQTAYKLGWSLSLLAFAQLIISLDINIVFVALPQIGLALNFSDQNLQWVVSAYTVFCGGFLLLGGRCADLLGQRRMFIIALWIYALSSLLGGLAWNPIIIIIARALQGIGGAMLFPATLSLINRLFYEGAARNRALAIWGGAGASGLTIGSLAGGILTQYFGWPSVFFVNVILAVVAIFSSFYLLPNDVSPKKADNGGAKKFDFLGAVSATLGITTLVFALVEGPELGWTSAITIISVCSAFLLIIIFVIIENKVDNPLMNLHLLRHRSLVCGVIITFVYMGTFGALPYFETIFFQKINDYTAFETGLAFIVPSISIFLGTQVGASLCNRCSHQIVLMIGALIGSFGILIMLPALFIGASYWIIAPGLVVSGIGQGIVWTAMWILAATGIRPQDQGIASGMASTSLNIGNAVGLAILIALVDYISNLQFSETEQLAKNIQNAFFITAIGIMIVVLISIFVPKKNSIS